MKGIEQADQFVLFLTDQCLTRPFVQNEIREAVRLDRKILLIHEQDPRHDAVDFGLERGRAPDDLKFLFDDIESIPWRRRAFERQAMLQELLRRAGSAYTTQYNKRRRPTRTERAMSVLSPHALFFDKHRWYVQFCNATFFTPGSASLGSGSQSQCPPPRASSGPRTA
jgi:hypothetical protein